MEKKSAEKSRTGIITFHCSDHYGAMLQAYGLKKYLRNRGIEADIIRYEPFFMTGRHWWIPYVPVNGTIGYIWKIWNAWYGWVQNLKTGKAFFIRKKKMRFFREHFLVKPVQDKLLFLRQFRKLTYSCYVVGSDQIWNPDITCGLRKAYFGAFKNSRKEKIVAYAASLGGTSLLPKYNRNFSRLLKYVDAVSVREREAVPYVQSMYGGPVTAVLDPVFLLDKEEWQRIERQPGHEGYILVYMTEKNDELAAYVKRLSGQKRLPVIELRSNAGVTDKDFLLEYTAGPLEFLGYLHRADYVVTNSFHGTVFSIIYQKKFTVFQHSKLGARIYNILRIHGLEHTLYANSGMPGIDAAIDWAKVKKRTEENVRISEGFLLKHIGK